MVSRLRNQRYLSREMEKTHNKPSEQSTPKKRDKDAKPDEYN
jgi:hypothetical protein